MKNINGSIETCLKCHGWRGFVGTVRDNVSPSVWGRLQESTILPLRDNTWFAFQNKLWKI